jgi:hypothetical protein
MQQMQQLFRKAGLRIKPGSRLPAVRFKGNKEVPVALRHGEVLGRRIRIFIGFRRWMQRLLVLFLFELQVIRSYTWSEKAVW